MAVKLFYDLHFNGWLEGALKEERCVCECVCEYMSMCECVCARQCVPSVMHSLSIGIFAQPSALMKVDVKVNVNSQLEIRQYLIGKSFQETGSLSAAVVDRENWCQPFRHANSDILTLGWVFSIWFSEWMNVEQQNSCCCCCYCCSSPLCLTKNTQYACNS